MGLKATPVAMVRNADALAVPRRRFPDRLPVLPLQNRRHYFALVTLRFGSHAAHHRRVRARRRVIGASQRRPCRDLISSPRCILQQAGVLRGSGLLFSAWVWNKVDESRRACARGDQPGRGRLVFDKGSTSRTQRVTMLSALMTCVSRALCSVPSTEPAPSPIGSSSDVFGVLRAACTSGLVRGGAASLFSR